MAEFSGLKILLPALLGGAVVSMLIERLLTPRPMLQRPAAAWLLHFGMWLIAFAFELSLFQRPWFAAAFVLAFVLFVVLVSNAKFSSLREPFIFSDFEYFTDALRHPRLYIPFLGWGRAALALAGFIAAVYGGLAFETPLTQAVGATAVFQAVGIIAALGVTMVAIGAMHLGPATYTPADDLQRLGLVASLWRYMADERKPIDSAAMSRVFPQLASTSTLANIVVVQSESFFDARRLFGGIDRNVLRHWDVLQRESVQHGRLKVAAWGANTVRTEFSFLSGLDIDSLGVHKFNPYRKLARSGIATLASYLRAQGYRTVCVHPYPASFYNRHIVFPKLGFDEFIDIKSFDTVGKSGPVFGDAGQCGPFDDASRCGPYIGDVTVAEKINALLAARAGDNDRPLFIFAITMENHGPLHWEKLSAAERQQYFTEPLPKSCDDLAVYVRHLTNADKMAGMLRAQLAASSIPAWLCFYGDHVPIMADVYAALGEPDGDTEYVIWGNSPVASQSQQRDLGIADLAATMLQHAHQNKEKNS